MTNEDYLRQIVREAVEDVLYEGFFNRNASKDEKQNKMYSDTVKRRIKNTQSISMNDLDRLDEPLVKNNKRKPIDPMKIMIKESIKDVVKTSIQNNVTSTAQKKRDENFNNSLLGKALKDRIKKTKAMSVDDLNDWDK